MTYTRPSTLVPEERNLVLFLMSLATKDGRPVTTGLVNECVRTALQMQSRLNADQRDILAAIKEEEVGNQEEGAELPDPQPPNGNGVDGGSVRLGESE